MKGHRSMFSFLVNNMKIKLSKATAKGKKLKAEIYHDDGSKKTIQFGQ